jgi:diguanylate cyclase
MMLDVDHFKKLNDANGHLAGDAVLRGVARVLERNVRGSDIVARYGGEEFAIIFAQAGLGACKEAAERARAAVGEASFDFEGSALRVTASGGLAELQQDDRVETLIRRADEALYFSKEAGRDCGHWHDGREIHPLARSPEPPSSSSREVNRDPLTGFPRQLAFYESVRRRIAEWKRGGAPVSVVLAQIDDFPSILEQHDRPGAELTLRAAAQFLRAATRDMDLVARFDDDIFAIMLPTATLPAAVGVAERMRRAISRCKLPLKNGERFTASLGAAASVENDSADTLINRAEMSLDTAVQAGCNGCYVHDGDRCRPADDCAAGVK